MSNLMSEIILRLGGTYQVQELIRQIVIGIAVASAAIAVVAFYSYYDSYQKEQAIYRIDGKKKTTVKNNVITDVWLKQLTANLLVVEAEKGKKEGWARTASMMCLVFCVGFGIFLITQGQVFFGIILPFVFLFIIIKVTGIMVDSIAEKIKNEMPFAIDSIIRALSKSDDLPTVLYDASQSVDEPLKSMFASMSVKMLNQDPALVLQEFMDNTKSIWTYSLSFTLLSYTEDTSKDDVVSQLRKLKAVIDKENKDALVERNSKKMTVTVNYALCVLAVVAFFGNNAINPMGKTFFFSSVAGIACFVIGTALVITTVFSNILLGKGRTQ